MYRKVIHPDLEKDFRELNYEKNDIRGLIRRGYKSLLAARYIFITIQEEDDGVPAARQYFKHLTDNHITTAGEKAMVEQRDPEYAVQVAFTSSGLRKLLRDENILQTFSREFIEGMSFNYKDENDPSIEIRERSTLLGDIGPSAPDNWDWGFDRKTVDAVLMLYAKTVSALNVLNPKIFTGKEKGLEEEYRSDTSVNDINLAPIEKEHFGFRDGISQPLIKGLTKSDLYYQKDELVEKGEFILGYENAYCGYSPSPYVRDDAGIGLPNHPTERGEKDLGKNGTYMVFRQIQQDVKGFWIFNYMNSKEGKGSPYEKATKLAAKMVGRWPNGQSLVKCPAEPCDPTDDKEMNDFKYARKDEHGIHCPYGAHVRRTNPRDQVHAGRVEADSMEISAKHRMLRRGRIYGSLLHPELDISSYLNKIKNKEWTDQQVNSDNEKRGLHFICMVTDITRQFEFVQSVWSNTSTFAELIGEVDPIIGSRPANQQPDCDIFTTPQPLVRNHYSEVPEFTKVVGGAYFFMPGIKALQFITRNQSSFTPA